ncbi:hypothetical protein [Bradyrhizobium sp. SYSU BS000235]
MSVEALTYAAPVWWIRGSLARLFRLVDLADKRAPTPCHHLSDL